MTPARRGFTLVEALVFGLIGFGVLMLVVGFLTRSSQLIGVGRETSAVQGTLRQLLATLGDDAGEMVHLDAPGADYDSNTGGKFSFVIHSRRAERGLPGTGEAGMRRVEYTLEGTGSNRTCFRTVTKLDGTSGTVRESVGDADLTRLRICPLVAFRNPSPAPGQPRYFLTRGNAPEAGVPGSTPVCLVIDVQAGEAIGNQKTDIDKAAITSIVTKLWCRNRVLELGRGGLR